jgi:hypothetical protein
MGRWVGNSTASIGKYLVGYLKMGEVMTISNSSQRSKPVNEILSWKVGKKE